MTSYDFFVIARTAEAFVRAIFPLVALVIGALVLLRLWRLYLHNHGTRGDLRGLSRRVGALERRLAELERHEKKKE